MNEQVAISVVTADEHEVVREGLRHYLDKQPEISVVGQAATGAATYELVRRTRPDVAIIDLRLRDMNGFDLCERLRRAFPGTAVVILSGYLSEDAVREAVKIGAADYVTKSAGMQELMAALHRVASGEAMINGDASKIVQNLCRSTADGAGGLTPRQARVAELVVDGKTYAQIAARLHISESTVRFHVQSLKDRFGVRSKSELVATVVRRALVTPREPVAG